MKILIFFIPAILFTYFHVAGQSIVTDAFNMFKNVENGTLSLEEESSTLENIRVVNGEKSKEYKTVLYLYALIDERDMDYSKAAIKLSALLEDLNVKNKSEYQDYLIIQYKLGLLFQDLGSLNLAKSEFEKLISNFNSKDKKTDLYCLSLHELALCLSDLYQYDIAKLKYEEVLSIRRKFFFQDKRNYTRLLNDMALNFHRAGEFQSSIKLNKECISIRKEYFGENYPGYMMSLNNLASDYSAIGNYDLAIEMNETCLRLRDQYLPVGHMHIIMSINNLGGNFFKVGNYDKAKEYFEQALKLLELNGKMVSSEYIYTYLGLSDVYDYLDDFGKSFEIRKNCFEIGKQLGDTNSFIYSIILTKLSQSYYDMGLTENALVELEKCLEIRERIFGKNHLQYAETVSNLAMLYKNLGKFEKSLEYLEEANVINLQKLGKNHHDYYYEIALKGQVYSEMGDFNKALYYANISLSGYKDLFGEKSYNYANVLNDIGYYQTRLSQFENAEKTLNQTISIKKELLNEGNSSLITTYDNLATVYLLQGNYNSFFENQKLILSSMREHFKSNELLFSNKQKESFKIGLSSKILSLISIVADSSVDSQNYKREIFDFWFDCNGVISSQNSEIYDRIKLTNDTTFIDLYDEFKSTQTLVNYYSEKTKDFAQNSGVDLEKLETKSLELKSKILQELSLEKEIQKTTNLKDIIEKLNTDEIYVEIIRNTKYSFLKNQWVDSSFYIAVLVDNTSRLETFVLPRSEDFEQIIFPEYSISNFSNNNKRHSIDSTGLYFKNFWKPIADKIGDAKTFYISLGGVYNNINLNTLYNPETGKYLIEEKDIRIVNSARDFVLSKEQEKIQYSTMTSALYGFPDFNGVNSSFDSVDLFASTRDLNYILIDTLTRGGMKASPLPATKIEIEQIATTFQKNGWTVNTFTGDKASETNIKREVSPRVLHVATHGYFFEDIPLDTTENRFLGMDRNRVVEDPMLRSGLLFTGANKTLQGEESKGENGLLSAAEASLLDLRETELVVLSACETGKGEVKNSEGVYGLRKAFADAGAKNIIMSLWKVDDKVTQEFMTRFYEIWLNDKTTIREAFNRTQLEIKAKYPQPYYWGAFILVGE